MTLNHSGTECDALGAGTDRISGVLDVCALDSGGLGGGRLVQKE